MQKTYYRFLQKAETDEPTWLASKTDSFSIADDEGIVWVYLPLSSDEEAKRVMATTPAFVTFEKTDLEENIDWETQWKDHSPNFKDHLLEVDLSQYADLTQPLPTLYLHPGPGFGDLSHPTTRLTLSMMAKHVKNKVVLDIGCGSGILTVAAILLGASSAIGIDIDQEAILHAQKNAALNELGDRILFIKPEDFATQLPADVVILMNMIRSQQSEAWQSLPQLHQQSGSCFTSGILSSEREQYLKECSLKGWSLVDEQQQENWMAFHFKL